MITLHTSSNFTCLSMFLLYIFCSVSSFSVETDLSQEILLGSRNMVCTTTFWDRIVLLSYI